MMMIWSTDWSIGAILTTRSIGAVQMGHCLLIQMR